MIDALRAEYQRLLDTYDYDRAAMTALELALLLHSEGRVAEARDRYQEALAIRQPEVIAQARQRAGWLSPAEQAFDLVSNDRREEAAALLAKVYEPSNVSAFALAVCGGYFDEAADMIWGMGGDLELADAGRIAVDLAGRFLRDHDGQAATEALKLVVATGFSSEMWEYALDSGSVADTTVATEVGTILLRLTWEEGDTARVIAIMQRAETRHPQVVTIGRQLLQEA